MVARGYRGHGGQGVQGAMVARGYRGHGGQGVQGAMVARGPWWVGGVPGLGHTCPRPAAPGTPATTLTLGPTLWLAHLKYQQMAATSLVTSSILGSWSHPQWRLARKLPCY